MSHWWDGAPDERYWCETTDRPDIGADLKCPQSNEKGNEYWSYALIREIAAGDIVFHYSTNTRAFVAASVAGGPIESRPIEWVPHGTVGRGGDGVSRPGWWLPLHGCTWASTPLTLQQLRTPTDTSWISDWTEEKRRLGAPMTPFQAYPTGLRAAQGYLTKMPRAFVDRWSPLSEIAAALEVTQERLNTVVADVATFPRNGSATGAPRSGCCTMVCGIHVTDGD
jgi:hypothetical protein